MLQVGEQQNASSQPSNRAAVETFQIVSTTVYGFPKEVLSN